ncbi:MAG: hypothetical protein UU40_C0025G0006 [Candidatus Uhrbacteria bacterium GW2011_GWD2_41_121]|uniref:Uncharacterized protein n=1 Tax=Candidatus Uhrbacteria bacterium GW2011_GWC1_41_20 TaxID=1618983 RepID=A0A0G0VER8_9BACT|nr:MAG: hypothetical protein UT52_C0031G0006 [Candidatus Uhrbacteria bacterium GW2011_GWE1_39_46]KKR63011.1 MAG: hypothetical protein UU04_C0031G0002 [Candidatus Uhrbacteria bacterium GW2011_GWC2_40_450]KKR89467.1 MAG: hypothetical protein UU40_C0025G0006 [Candidatus Uhrbacteria bacterium GW2011_GWD2_41_121]KKR95519.1 MAG: hypothetical protein UU46_C0022G0009 [Candidatus Uhrbacteria bacterium GW2011_GWD1_41_16]KKR98131.1 MAG: hypothetical protein UU50_C0021G0009 [Candidatus Uhrbacteria bacteriu
MERKEKIEIGIAVLVIVVLVGVLWWVLQSGSSDLVPSIDSGTDQATEDQQTPVIDYTAYETTASTIARVFVERFGSFSNQADYENVNAVMDIATSTLQNQLKTIMSKEQDTDVYYGISTRVLSIDQVSITDTQEVLEVMTQREESIESPANTTIRYQSMKLTLVKNGDSWLVNDFVWE